MTPVSGTDGPALPGTPPPVLRSAYEALTPERRAALLPHLIGKTGTDYLSDWLRRAGVPVGATTVKSYRRSLRQIGVTK